MKRLSLFWAFLVGTLLLTSCQNAEEYVPQNTEADDRQTLILARSDKASSIAENYVREDENRLIAGFNSTNTDYYIQEQLYESGDNLAVDIYAGKNIDLLCLGSWIDPAPLYNKGLLCDLNVFIDNDTEVSRDDFVEPVLSVLETNGKLFQMPYNYFIESAVVRADLWGDDTDTSFDHIIEVAEKNGCTVPFYFTFDSYEFIPYITAEYIDYSAGTCSFNDGRFEEFLGFMKKYTDITSEIDSSDKLYDMFNRGEILLLSGGFAYFDQIEYDERDFGVKMKFIGFPSETENYHIANPQTSFAIFSQSEKQAGAFEFIKYYTSYDSYISKETGSSLGGGLSINKKALEHLCELSIEQNVLNLDEEQKRRNNEEIMQQIYTVNGAGNQSGNFIASVLSEETQLYFNGDKSAAEVCEIIQNRLTTYFEEQK